MRLLFDGVVWVLLWWGEILWVLWCSCIACICVAGDKRGVMSGQNVLAGLDVEVWRGGEANGEMWLRWRRVCGLLVVCRERVWLVVVCLLL